MMASTSKRPNLSVLFFNSNSIKGKLNEIKALNEVYKPDIVSICETKIDNTFDDNELFGQGYTVTRKDRTFHGGGVLVATNNNTLAGCVVTSVVGTGESIITSIKLSQHVKFNLITFYRPPQYSDLEELSSILEFDSQVPSIVIGDINLPDIVWKDGFGTVKLESNKFGFHKRALDIITSNNFKQLVSEPTHKKFNTLDLILINTILLDDLYVDHRVLPPISDHNAIILDIACDTFLPSKPSKPLPKYNYKRADFSKISVIYDELLNELPHIDCKNQWDRFTETVSLAKTHIPVLLTNPKNKAWITRDIIRLIRKRDRVFQRCKEYPTTENILLEKQLAKEVKTRVRKAKSDFLKLHITGQLSVGNTKPLYKFISNNRGHSNTICSLDGVDQNDIPNTLAQYFSSVFVTEEVDERDLPSISCNIAFPMANISVDIQGLIKLVDAMDRRKSSGPDKISAYFLQSMCKNVSSFSKCLRIIIDSSINSGFVPFEWRRASICPMFKGGKRNQAQNYRPISLTSLVSKMCEHIVNTAMWAHIEKNGILSDKQHGFRRGYNTTTQLLHVLHNSSKALDNKHKYHLVSFDFSKAFDKVPHSKLIHKLRQYKFNDNVICWIKNWLSDRTFSVKVNNFESDSFPVKSGVPQGSVLGPLLFLLYIDDMINTVKFSDCRLYADDSLLCFNETLHGPTALQEDVDAMQNWAHIWGMSFNVEKCVHLRVGREPQSIDLFLLGKKIPQRDSLKYLGLHIEATLKWHDHILNTTKKANKVLGLLRRSISEADSRTKLIAVNTVARPILEYASPVWSPYTKSLIGDIDRVHRRSIRWTYKLQKLDSVTETMELHKLQTLHDRRMDCDILFLRKIEFGDYKLKLENYVTFNDHFNTRGKTINPHFNTNGFRHSYFNRIRSDIKVFPAFDDAD